LKKHVATTTLFLICTAMGFAQTSGKFEAWSVYPPAARNGETTTLLQTNSLESVQDAEGRPMAFKLDVICKKGKPYRVALETTTPVSKRAMNFSGEAVTTPVSFQADGSSPEVQSWAVLDNGHTISPYSELMQGKRNRSWIERLGGTNTLVLELPGVSSQNPIRVSFDTKGISEALAAAGCSY
jgi:hypothetical protein